MSKTETGLRANGWEKEFSGMLNLILDMFTQVFAKSFVVQSSIWFLQPGLGALVGAPLVALEEPSSHEIRSENGRD